MDVNISKGPDHRERVATFLTLMASESAREALGRWIDQDRLAFELCRIWFDEIYLPSRRYFDALKGDYSEAAADRFRTAFSADELAGLERFTRFLELRMEMLSSDARSARRVPNNDAWQGLVRHAFYMLDDLEPDSEYRRARLSEDLSRLDRDGTFDADHVLAAVLTPPADSSPGR